MPTCSVTFDIADANGESFASADRQSIKYAAAVEFDTDAYRVIGLRKNAALITGMVKDFERQQAFHFNLPDGSSGYYLIPDTATANFTDLVRVPATPAAPIPTGLEVAQLVIDSFEAEIGDIGDALDAKADTTALATEITNRGTAVSGAISTAAADATAKVATEAASRTSGDALAATKAGNLADLASPAVAREVLAVSDYDKLRPWFADLANRRTKRADVLFMGDSGVEGYSLTAWKDTLPSQLASELRTRFPTYDSTGTTPVKGGRGLVGVQNDGTNQPFWPVVYTSGARSAAGFGPNGRQVALSGSGHKFVQTVEAGGITGFYLHYAVFGTGTFYYKIDGGANVNVITNGTGTIVPTRLLVALPVTSTIEVGWVSGASYISGVQELRGDESAGISVHNCGWSGTYASYWQSLAGASWPGHQALLAPSLIVINLGGNDGRTLGANQSAATFKTNMLALIATIKTAMTTNAPYAPIVLNMQWGIGDAAMNQAWSLYVTAAKEIAAADSRVVCVDHSGTTTTGRMYPSNTSPDTLALYNAASPPHALPKGYALEAATLATALSPR